MLVLHMLKYSILYAHTNTVYVTGELALAVGLRAPDARWTATCHSLQTAIKRFVYSKCGTVDSSSSSTGKAKKHGNGSTLTSATASSIIASSLKGLVAPLPNDEVLCCIVNTIQYTVYMTQPLNVLTCAA